MKTENIGKNLKRIREKRQIKQEVLAKALKIKTPNISQYENQKTIPTLQTLIKIAEYFETSVDYFLTEHHEK